MHGAARKSWSAIPIATSMRSPYSAMGPSHLLQSVPMRS